MNENLVDVTAEAPAPSFLRQHEMTETLRATFRRTLLHLTGAEPSDAEVDDLIRAELAESTVVGEPAAVRPPAALSGATGENLPLAATWLSQSQLREAESALWFATLHGIDSLVEALSWYVKHRHGALDAPPLRQCLIEFQIAKRCEGVRPATLRGYRINLRRFEAEFGGDQPRTVTPKRLSDYLLRFASVSVRRAQWEALSTFFHWAVKRQYAFENPVPLAMARPKRYVPGRFILTPAEARELLRRAKDTKEIGYWALALFTGLRPMEIKRLQEHPDPWSLIHLDTGLIEVRSRTSKTRSRQITIQPVLREWLRWIRQRRVRFYPTNFTDKCRWIRAVFAHRPGLNRTALAAKAAAKDQRFYNITRRSFLSYQLALPGASYAAVSKEAGNSEVILRRYYQHRVTRSESLAYFGLSPQRV